MSVPRHLGLAPEVSPATVTAASGELAALVATPPDGTATRGEALLVPGFTGSKEDFLHLLPLLARSGYAATAIDLRGQYESGGPEDISAYTIPALGADVASLVGPGMHVVGHSFGGLVCREAVLAGAPAASLTLLGSGPAALDGTRGALVELMRPILREGGVPAVWAASQAVEAEDPAVAARPAEVKDFLQRRFLASPAAAMLQMGVELTTAPDRTGELAALGLPVLVVHGSADDAWAPPVQADMADRLGARLVVVDGAGHSPAVDDPETTAAVLVGLWSSLPRR